MSKTISVNFVNWSNLSQVVLPSSYKLRTLESDEQHSMWTVYMCLYPKQAVEKTFLAETIKTYSSVTVGEQPYGSKREGHYLRFLDIARLE